MGLKEADDTILMAPQTRTGGGAGNRAAVPLRERVEQFMEGLRQEGLRQEGFRVDLWLEQFADGGVKVSGMVRP